MKEVLDEKLQEIMKFARKKNNMITYSTVVDILKDKEEQLSEQDIVTAIEELGEHGIIIVDANFRWQYKDLVVCL